MVVSVTDKEQYGTTKPNTSKYMLDANQSLRISLENLVGTVRVFLKTTQLYLKKQAIWKGDHNRETKACKKSIITDNTGQSGVAALLNSLGVRLHQI